MAYQTQLVLENAGIHAGEGDSLITVWAPMSNQQLFLTSDHVGLVDLKSNGIISIALTDITRIRASNGDLAVYVGGTGASLVASSHDFDHVLLNEFIATLRNRRSA